MVPYLTGALQYIYGLVVRCKESKPNSVFVSPTGLLLTDFGHSTDFVMEYEWESTMLGQMHCRSEAVQSIKAEGETNINRVL
jgi:hypothetical protein